MKKILLLLLLMNILFGASKELFDGKQRWDLTFEDNENDVYQKIWTEVDKVAVELDKINALVPRKANIQFCDEKGCGIDAVRCDPEFVPVECPEGGELDGNLDMCILPANTDCPDGYSPDSNLTLCTSEPPCDNGLTYDSDSNHCVGVTTESTGANINVSCPDSSQVLTNGKCCEPTESPANHVVSCAPGEGTLSNSNSTKCNKTCYQPPSCPNGGTLTNSFNYTCPNGGTLSGTTCYKTCSGTELITCKYLWHNGENESYCTNDWFAGNNPNECPNASTLSQSQCVNKTIEKPLESSCNYQATKEYNNNTTKCSKTCSSNSYSCPNGGYLSGTTCYKTCSQTTSSYTCPHGGYLSGSTCYKSYAASSYSGLYQLVLGRQTDNAGYAYWKNKWGSSISYSEMIAFIHSAVLNNEPYICGMNMQPNNTRKNEVMAAYVWELGRCPDTAGFNYWVGDPNWSITAFKNAASPECSSNGLSCPNTPPLVEYTCPYGGYISNGVCHYSYHAQSGTNTTYYSCNYTATGNSNTAYWNCNYNPTVTTSFYDCSYDAPDGSYQDCSYQATQSNNCEEGNLVGNVCEGSLCTDPTEEPVCPEGSNQFNCEGFEDKDIVSLYTNNLCKCPDRAGYNHWVSKKNEGYDFAYISNEFFHEMEQSGVELQQSCSGIQNNTVTNNGTSTTVAELGCQGNFPNDFIFNVYTNNLCRCPDQAGYDYWLQKKNSGKSDDWIKNAIHTATYANADTWSNSCSEIDTSKCYTSEGEDEIVDCPNDPSYIYNDTIALDEELDKCTSGIDISCDADYVFSTQSKTCEYSPPCEGDALYSGEVDACVVKVTCPYGPDIECQGPSLLDSWCSPWKCNDVNRCGFAYCENGTTPSNGTDYMPPQYFDYYQYKVAGACSSEQCDLTLNKDITYCLDVTCPEGFGIYESGGSCYRDECPGGSTIDEDGNCFIQECPEGTTEQADGNCLQD